MTTNIFVAWENGSKVIRHVSMSFQTVHQLFKIHDNVSQELEENMSVLKSALNWCTHQMLTLFSRL